MNNIVSNQNTIYQIAPNAYKTIEDISQRFNQSTPLKLCEIANFYDQLFSRSIKDYAEKLMQDPYSIPSLVSKLHRAFRSIKMQAIEMSSNAATWLLDVQTGERLFVAKIISLQEASQFGVPEYGGQSRERLYYLMDTKQFAGVPPTFLILNGGCLMSVQLALEGKDGIDIVWNGPGIYKDSIRRCIIHQFRTVNMDPSTHNYLLISSPKKAAVPIDGGYILPFQIKRSERFINVEYDPISKIYKGSLFDTTCLDEPFHLEEIEYIQNISLEEDAQLIKTYLVKERKHQLSIKICQAANLILKRAVDVSLQDRSLGKNATITLHDLCLIREARWAFNWMTSPEDLKEIDKRINDVFNYLRQIKECVLAHEEEVLDDQRQIDRSKLHQLAINMLKQFSLLISCQPPHVEVQDYKTIMVKYILGSREYESQASCLQKGELNTLLKAL